MQCSFYLYSLTDPIIETSQQMKFAPFNGAYNGIERVREAWKHAHELCRLRLTAGLFVGGQHFDEARLEPTNNHWSQVYDFNDPDKSGDNWKLMCAYLLFSLLVRLV